MLCKDGALKKKFENFDDMIFGYNVDDINWFDGLDHDNVRSTWCSWCEGSISLVKI